MTFKIKQMAIVQSVERFKNIIDINMIHTLYNLWQTYDKENSFYSFIQLYDKYLWSLSENPALLTNKEYIGMMILFYSSHRNKLFKRGY